MPAQTPRLLLVSMYPLDQGRWGPTVRIANLRDELQKMVRLDVVSGYRGSRRVALMRYAFSGRLRGLDGIYVESSTFLPAETDIAFLGLARALGIPVLTYVRDAYQLFDEDYYRVDSLRRRLGARAFLPAVRALATVSSRLAFPSRGLARAVVGDAADEALFLPPGSRAPIEVPRAPGARRLLFVGNGRLQAQGARRLIEAVDRARRLGAAVDLTIVSRPGEEPLPPRPDWLTVMNGEGATIEGLLPEVVATVIPRPSGPYNDLAVPVKLYDYLAYGRPLLVTDCLEQAAVVRDANAGLVIADDPDGMADGILRLLAAGAAQLDRWSENAHRAALAASWQHRARQVVEALQLTP